MDLFVSKHFVSHAGKDLSFKIDCDALSDEIIETFASVVAKTFKFGTVYGIPSGGLRFAKALEKYKSESSQILIVDDVLTTGASMETARRKFGLNAIGIVIFARGACPSWICPMYQQADWVDRKK